MSSSYGATKPSMSRPTCTWASKSSASSGITRRSSSSYPERSLRARPTASSTAPESTALGCEAVGDLLIYGDTVRSPELRHEVPVPVPDPFLYVERNGSRYAFVGSLEIPRMRELDGLQAVPLDELGMDELIAQGLTSDELDRELVLRACQRVGVDEAVAPRTFPLDVADHLRANGVQVRAHGQVFDARRRVKTEAEREGIRSAQRATEGAMDSIRARLRAGGKVTCEDLRSEAMLVFTEAGMILPDIVIVSHGAQTAVGHEPGYGEIQPGEPIVVDLYPQDPESGCYTDMSRTRSLSATTLSSGRRSSSRTRSSSRALQAQRRIVPSASSSRSTVSRPS